MVLSLCNDYPKGERVHCSRPVPTFLPSNARFVAVRAPLPVVDLQVKGEIVVAGWLLDDTNLVATPALLHITEDGCSR